MTSTSSTSLPSPFILTDKTTPADLIKHLELEKDDPDTITINTQKINGLTIRLSSVDQLRSFGLTAGIATALFNIAHPAQAPGAAGGGGGQAPETENVSFWVALQTCAIDPTSMVLTLPNGLHFLGNPSKRSSLYVRECYEEMKNLIFAQFDRYEGIATLPGSASASSSAPPPPDPIYGSFVVTGTPGIGKSCFLYYLMLEIAKKKAPLVVHSIHSNSAHSFYLYTFDGNGTPIVNRGPIELVIPYLTKKSTYYLVDSLKVSNAAAKTIIVSSPDPALYKEFLKNDRTTRMFMPPWEKDELDHVKPLLYPQVPQATLEDLWLKWGGIPRFVLEKAVNAAFQHSLENGITTLDLDTCAKSVGEEDPQAPGSHKIIQIIPIDISGIPKYGAMVLRFSSKYVASKVANAIAEKNLEQVKSHLSVPRFLHSPLGGSFLEAVVHRQLKEHGGQFQRRALKTNLVDTITFPRPSSSAIIKSITDIGPALDNIYLVPSFSNFPAIDSLIKPNQLFQVTVSADHPPLMKELTSIVDQLGATVANVELYFVLPQDQFSSFKEQHYLTTSKTKDVKLTPQVKKITQYALLFEL
ncbi:hypothetical protein SAMD00019534_066510 [Acytostelium subglobosum LB1]|uniref:hypothetical protein n=1 Tax=Acytostelium subglobosum LB1 TaxID=1410327 RepID=UPI000644AC58|nr:hypothetical protein SAMD00019534_066510 [Acytostelium subglobosum LB1]GAM23476.1 hypothetical protein SAMD00019534_066510 [Acytostelium subglobosum LB1]|eukprot:XP_012753925.1 hypothetical protein SAMD00019534_066510 [Acytostelium subglobosum LB1]